MNLNACGHLSIPWTLGCGRIFRVLLWKLADSCSSYRLRLTTLPSDLRQNAVAFTCVVRRRG